ncbi:MAG: GAF domain-containing sensor histidine kinase [Mesorhizobium sp.]|nr:GAF domain-containing sensor histidine kinase [Mesorhizobium sp.]MBL8575604.1 GAF domain-containing sensor histidine kinase [Mesorhizobium sp.]
MPHEFQTDIDAINRIAAVPTILDVVCRATGMRFVAVARVTQDRWITCSVLDNIDFGLRPGGELKVETTICHEIRQSGEPVVIDNVSEDDVFCGHPTPAMYGFQSYISMPIIRKDGTFFGTLCAIDPAPAKLRNPETIGMFKLFAELIAAHLDASDELSAAQEALTDERKVSELREQFIAVLGHDLRNPLASINAGTKILLRSPLDASARKVVDLMQGSVVRMKGLIDNVLDFARARLGDSLDLEIDDSRPLAPFLGQVVDELRAVEPTRDIKANFRIDRDVPCDKERISQLFSNLLGNALTHGAPGSPITVEANTDGGSFTLWVENSGKPIPESLLPTLFQPFFRGEARQHHGLGLGLYIAHEIARLHGGELDVKSDENSTRFTFTMLLAG